MSPGGRGHEESVAVLKRLSSIQQNSLRSSLAIRRRYSARLPCALSSPDNSPVVRQSRPKWTEHCGGLDKIGKMQGKKHPPRRGLVRRLP